MARLTVSDFRCYSHARIETDGRPVVLIGPNGAGKTNLLEALSFLAPGRGLRGARLADVGRAGSPGPWAVAARLATPRGPVDLGTGLEAGARPGESREKRTVRIDGESQSAQAALAKVLSVQWLVPAMDRLFLDGPSARRRFLDRLVFGTDPAHAGRVQAYEQALRQRQRLLAGPGPGAHGAWLSALEETIAAKGIAVAAARRELARGLDGILAAPPGPFPGARLAITGEVDGWLDGAPAIEAEDRFRARLAADRPADADRGRTRTGPHRTDLGVTHLAKNQDAALCSTGEQKALLIALILAHARLRARAGGPPAFLLLDEVAAHLDDRRRRALFDEICALGGQVWMSGTDRAAFAGLDGGALFLRVADAAIRPL